MKDTKKAQSSRRLLFSMNSSSHMNSLTSMNEKSVSNDDSPYIAKVFEQFSGIDNFIKALLTVVIDEDEKEAIFSLYFMKNVMLQKNNIGPWIIDMLDSPLPHTRTNVIDYLKRLSILTEEERTFLDDSQLDEIEHLVEKLRDLHNFIPSMMSLTNKMAQEAATIPLIARALDKKMTSTFVSCTLFFDMLMLVVLLTTFRLVVDDFFIRTKLSNLAYYLANASTFYLILRTWGKLVSLYYFFKRFSIYEVRASKLWTILHTSSIGCSWICLWFIGYFKNASEAMSTIDLYNIRVFMAFTTVILWLHLIETTTYVNIQLATFVLAIRKVMLSYLIDCCLVDTPN